VTKSCVAVCACLLGCGHAAPATTGPKPSGEEVLEQGGELADVDAARATVSVTADRVVVWGVTEVPDGSRMQMALAGVDAITRAELLKAIEVRVSGVVTSVESKDPAQRSVVVETVEAVSGALKPDRTLAAWMGAGAAGRQDRASIVGAARCPAHDAGKRHSRGRGASRAGGCGWHHRRTHDTTDGSDDKVAGCRPRPNCRPSPCPLLSPLSSQQKTAVWLSPAVAGWP